MMSTHIAAPDHVRTRYNDPKWTWVGTGHQWNHFVPTENTCLKQVCPPWSSFGETNFGFCRMPKGHDGPCADEVRTCDACDTTYPADDENIEWTGNEDVQFCGRCH